MKEPVVWWLNMSSIGRTTIWRLLWRRAVDDEDRKTPVLSASSSYAWSARGQQEVGGSAREMNIFLPFMT